MSRREETAFSAFCQRSQWTCPKCCLSVVLSPPMTKGISQEYYTPPQARIWTFRPKPLPANQFAKQSGFWVFREGVDSARGIAAIVAFCRNSSCNSPCDAIVRSGRETITFFSCFECNSSFAIVDVKGRSNMFQVWVAAASIAIAPRFHPFSKHPSLWFGIGPRFTASHQRKGSFCT